METLPEDLTSLDGDIEEVTAKMLSTWDWKTENSDSLQSSSPQSSSSFDSCSSPETSSSSHPGFDGSSGHPGFENFPPYGLASARPVARAPQKPHSKAKMSTRRRIKASEREKMRMRSLAEALHHLRDYLPPDYSKRGQPLTKIQTLKYTIEYIKELSEILSHA